MAEQRVNCPVCPTRGKSPDRKKHCYINPARNVAICFRCGYRTRNAASFAARYGLHVTQAFATLHPVETPTLRLPPEFSTDFTSVFGRTALAYLQERQVPPATIAAYGLGYCDHGRYGGRVIVPVHGPTGDLETYVARLLYDAEPKYLRPCGGAPAALFNLRRAMRRGVLCLVEGVFDALRIPAYGVALLGKDCSGARRARLLEAKPAVVVIALDADADKEAETLRRSLTGFVRVLRYRPAGHDLGAATPAEITQLESRLARLGAGEGAAAAGP